MKATSIQTVFEQRAAQYPDRTAIVSPLGNWSYAQLDRYANTVAVRLYKEQVQHGSLVGVCAASSPEIIGVLLGVLKAGAAYVPLATSYPDERLRYMLTDTEPGVVIVDETGLAKLAGMHTSATLLPVQDLIGQSGARNEVAVQASDLAYIMYTSGSSGRPKGVMIEHRGILRLVCDPNYITFSPHNRFLQLAPLSFDASTFEIWAALLNGASLVVLPTQTPALSEIAEALDSFRVDTLWLTSGLFNAFVDECPHAFRNVARLLAGGDILSPVHVRKALDRMPDDACIINGYGPTENTTFTCCYAMRKPDVIRDPIPIGRPISGTQVYIVDEYFQQVRPGETGEILIGGEGLARGYWKDPVLTSSKFIANPFPDEPSGNLYRSGDLGRVGATGNVEFLGRVDLQLKIRGFRVEPSEIEATIYGLESVASAAVIGTNSPTGDKRLSCFFVPRSGSSVTATDLEFYLTSRLPAYMLPGEFIVLPELPLDANGKIDRKGLSDRRNSGAKVHSGRANSPGTLELQLAEMLRKLLRIPAVDPNDDIFQIGGHSLLAARFLSQIEERFGRRLPLTVMLQARTIRALAAIIKDENWAVPWSSLVPLRESGSSVPLFLVHAIGGNILTYRDLAVGLAAEQPVYALQAQGLDGTSPVASSVEEMAAHYIRAMRSVQQEGPYYLGGFSAGGVVAFEMACQLESAGSSVALLILLDTTTEPPLVSLVQHGRFVEASRRFGRFARWNLWYLRRSGFIDFARKKTRNFRMNFRIACFNARRSLAKRMRTASTHRLAVEDAFLFALGQYRPGTFSGNAVLFRAVDSGCFSSDPALGWREVVKGTLDIREIPGTHDDLFAGVVNQTLVGELQRALNRARAPISNLAEESAKHCDSSGVPNDKQWLGDNFQTTQ